MGRAALAAVLGSNLALASCTLISLDQLQGLGGGGNDGGNGTGADNPDGGTHQGASGAGEVGGSGGEITSSGGGGNGTGGEVSTYADCVLAHGPAVFLALSGTTTEPNLGSLGGTAAYNGGHEIVTPGLVVGGDAAHTFELAAVAGELALDGASDIFGGFQPFSIELWMTPPSPIASRDLFRFALGLDRLTLEIQAGVAGGDDSFRFRYRTLAGDERAATHFLQLDDRPGEIHHVVAVYRQTNATIFDGSGTANDLLLYVDGALAQPTGCCSEVPMFDVTAPLQIGGGFEGALDDVAVYDRELTPTEILEHFELGSGALECVP